jgi:hypothetical protein
MARKRRTARKTPTGPASAGHARARGRATRLASWLASVRCNGIDDLACTHEPNFGNRCSQSHFRAHVGNARARPSCCPYWAVFSPSPGRCLMSAGGCSLKFAIVDDRPPGSLLVRNVTATVRWCRSPLFALSRLVGSAPDRALLTCSLRCHVPSYFLLLDFHQ